MCVILCCLLPVLQGRASSYLFLKITTCIVNPLSKEVLDEIAFVLV
jgi:hypothetical protein